MRASILLLITIGLIFSCRKSPKPVETAKEQGVIAEHAMVVSAREEASKIGIEIMQKGGNAFDALVATELALAVSYPYAGNIGGGGFMVYRLADGTTGSLDFRETAPSAATETMYLDENGEVIPRKSLDGALAVGVPGTIAGLWEAHQKFGTLPWKDLVQPAIDMARKGVVITELHMKQVKKHWKTLHSVNKDTIPLTEDFRVNDSIQYIKLANTLEFIKEKGKDGFYEGPVAEKMVGFLNKNEGIITLDDLKNYKPVWRDALTFDFKDYTIISMPPPSSGGIVLGQILKTLEHYPLEEMEHNSAEYVHLLAEAERRAYADRSHFLGDPDFVNIPIETLLSDSYLKERMRQFNSEKATPSSEVSYGTIPGYESMETTHYSVVDQHGNAVAVTTTLNGAFGSKLYDPELGFFYNNEMDDFSIKPGEPNLFGLIGAEANKIEPNKRMLSSMTPTIVEKDGKLFMVLGSPGGSTIITSVLQNMLNTTIFNMGMQESVGMPRFHHQWLPDEILMEPEGFPDSVRVELEGKNHTITEKESVVIGKVNAILVLPDGKLEGGADPRGEDTAMGH